VPGAGWGRCARKTKGRRTGRRKKKKRGSSATPSAPAASKPTKCRRLLLSRLLESPRRFVGDTEEKEDFLQRRGALKERTEGATRKK
jgi:hypothetical protein